MVDVSIIIVNYNTVNLIVDAIKSVIQMTMDINFEVIVVDNCSSDNSKEILQNEFQNKIKHIALPANIGFGRANNEGIKIAQGRNILFLNPDTILLNNAIKILSDTLDSDEQIGACGGNLYDENKKPTHSYRMIFPSIYWEINDLLSRIPEKIILGKNSEFNHTYREKKVAYITGADLMIKKSVIDQVGIFSPLFFMYYEETDLCFRIKKANFNIVSVPNAKIIHLESKSFAKETINTTQIKMSEESRCTYYKIHYSALYKKIADAIYSIHIHSRIIIFFLFYKKKYIYWKTVLDIFKAAKQKCDGNRI
ncbi:glycosyltransferase family 2 protein [Paludibacter sp. 221]|uniref:glycosyltransferase family 2 protein n=1 Tax=Paludibacter sp. 221 TaxID=2302939 RepID=UPI0013D6507F|nr:glycosyltransferase family 2 protein [Paludibacter sp. 221]NDV47422.1 glycosyltransferase family 2 protein [Paludibacter sp. 221]